MLQCNISNGLGLGGEFDAEWNSLCGRCQNGSGTIYSEVIAELKKEFFPGNKLSSVSVRDEHGKLVAGLPLIEKRSSGIFHSLATISNDWWPTNPFLVDQQADLAESVSAILKSLAEYRTSHLWLDWLPIDRPEWQVFAEQAHTLGWSTIVKRRFEVGIARLPNDWASFEKELSRNSRKRVRGEWKQIHSAGKVEFEIFSGGDAEGCEQAVNTALEIELHSWKGKQQSAIACNPSARAFYTAAAQLLNRSGHLRIFLMKLDGRAIAFDFGELAGSNYRSIKVSYDDQFSSLSPGHVLNQFVLRHLIESGCASTADTVGPMNQANQRWSNDSYFVGRLVIAPGSWLSNPPGRSLVSLLRAKNAWSGTDSSGVADVLSPTTTLSPSSPIG